MALSISSYNPRPYVSNVELPEYDLNLVAKVMQDKQNKFDKNYNALQSYKNTALNVRFLNEEKQGDVDKLNKELEDNFKSVGNNFGDLSDGNIYNGYVAWFDKFKNNTGLISAYQEDKKWQNSLGDMESTKKSKDPYKNGYSQTNELVFKYDLARYMKSKNGEKIDFEGYVPYVDIVKEATELWKNMPKKKETKDTIMGDGTIRTDTFDGYTDKEMQTMLNGLSPNAINQFKIEAKADFIRGKTTNPVEYRNQLSSKYGAFLKTQQDETKETYNNAAARYLAESDPEKKQELLLIRNQAEAKLNNLPNSSRSTDWFNNATDEELLSVAIQMHSKAKLEAIGKTLAGTKSVQYKQDPAYFSRIQTQLAYDRFREDNKFRAFKFGEDNKFRNREFLADEKYREKDLQIKNADLKIKQDAAKSKDNNDELNGNTFLDVTDSPLRNGDENQSVDAYTFQFENGKAETAKAAYDIFAGDNNLKIEIDGRQQTTDELIQRALETYETGSQNGQNPARGIGTLEEFAKKHNLTSNLTFNMLVKSIDQIHPKLGNGDISHKVGAVKILFTDFMNGKDKGNNFNHLRADKIQYQNLKNYETTQNGMLNDVWTEVKKAHPELDINNPADAKTMYEEVMNKIMEKENVSVYKREYINFDGVGQNPTKETRQSFDNRNKLAADIRNATGMNINPNIISHSETSFDGVTIVKFKNEFSDGDKKNTATINGKTYMSYPVKGEVNEGKILRFKRKPQHNYDVLNQTNYDRQGTIDHEVSTENGAVRVQFYKAAEGTTVLYNGVSIKIAGTENVKIKEIKERIDQIINFTVNQEKQK